MLVQFYNPTDLSKDQLDYLLAEGWFRSSMMLHKSKVICLDYDIFSIVNIRYHLQHFEPKKRHRKLIRKVERDFNVEIQPFEISEEKEQLYQKHKSRFKGFIHDDLDQLMHAYTNFSVFDTYEVNIYHENKLVAFSFFDLGKSAIASILAVYNHDFGAYSLGIYSMLAEVNYGRQKGFKWYYPGYVLDKPSEFDYKLSIGTPQYRTSDGEWTHPSNIDFNKFAGTHIKKKVAFISNKLEENSIEHIQRDNPYYSLAYVPDYSDQVMRGTTITILKYSESEDWHWCLEYIAEKEIYLLSKAGRNIAMDFMLDMETTDDLNDDSHYIQGIWIYFEKVAHSSDLNELIHIYLQHT